MDPPDPPDYSMTSSVVEDWSDHSPASPSFPTNSHHYDLLVDQPPPSILPSEASSPWISEASSPWTSGVNSALASDSDSPPPPTKAAKQTNLLGFFPKVSAEEPHTKWRKRKQDNEDMDRKEHAEHKQKDEADKLRKLKNKRARNKASQKKWRDRIREEKATLSEEGQDSLVSLLVGTN